MKSTEQFNAELKAHIEAAGYNRDELIVGTVTAELRAAFDAMAHAIKTERGGFRTTLALERIADTASRILALTSDYAKVEPVRTVEVAEIVAEKCLSRADEFAAAVAAQANPNPQEVN